MNVFQTYYSVFYSVMCFAGLWPFDESIKSRIRRTAVLLIMFASIVIQVSSIKHVELTFQNMLTTLSFTLPLLMCFFRYIGFVMNFPAVKFFLENLQHDYDMLKNPDEMEIFTNNLKKSKQIINIFFAMLSITLIAAILLVPIPILLHTSIHLNIMQSLGYFYFEYNIEFNLICGHAAITSFLSVMTFVCTEGILSVITFYLRGLFKIVCYRIRSAVNDTASKLITSEHIDIGPAVVLHQKAYQLGDSVGRHMTLSSLVIILIVIASLAMNLYRVSIAEI
ncbi:uncharacterized protein LOC143259628 [Megalopta genalis]|uniref:uncharacterized protein LOC143259628 n=1 Tax=Megalopta genalis TaxID=115081 RepID=UPI003FD38FC2